MKKAEELTVICKAQVYTIIYSSMARASTNASHKLGGKFFLVGGHTSLTKYWQELA
jgi:hypothetical protein